MDLDCPIRDRLTHLTLLREHYGDEDLTIFPEDPDRYDWKFGEDGSGDYDMLETAGVPGVIQRGSCVLYLGRAAHDVPPEAVLFDYGAFGPQAAAAVEPVNFDAASNVSIESDDGELAPDAPDALAPPSGQDLWVMKVEDVVAIQREDGLWCTYVVGTTFVTKSYMEHVYAQNVIDRLVDVLQPLHPRQHVKTDLWDVARAHNLVGPADVWFLGPGALILPPPVGAITTFRIWTYPGCIFNLADDVRKHTKKGAVFRGDDVHVRCVCKGCDDEYIPGHDVMAYCVMCRDDLPVVPWYHERCATVAPAPSRLTSLIVELGEDDIEAPAIRRAPADTPPIWLDAPRGIRVRVDCPVRTWERVSLVVWRAGQEVEGSVHSEDELMDVVRSYAAQGDEQPLSRPMPEVEVQRALRMETSDADGFRLLYCPGCGAVM